MTTMVEVSSTERYDVVTVNENFEAVSAAALLGIKRETTVDLTLGLYGGMFWTGSAFSLLADTTVALTGSATNYVEANRTTGAVTVNQSAFTAGRIRLYTITTTADGINAVTDYRTLHLQGGNIDIGTLTAAKVTITQGTLTDPDTGLTLTATWNDAADTFVAASIDVTDTNSAAGSMLQRWRVGGTRLVSIDKSGRLIFGDSAALTVASTVNGQLQLLGTTTNSTSLTIARYSADNAPGVIMMQKSRGATIDSHGALSAADFLFQLIGAGSDGAGYFNGVRFSGRVDVAVTPSSGIVPGRINLETINASGTMTIGFWMDSAQKVAISGSAPLTFGQSNRLQVHGTGSINGGLGLGHWSADAVGAKLEFAKSRNASIAGNTIVQSGDVLGEIAAYGNDGTNYDPAAQILFEVDGTPGAGTDMPGRVRFLTSANGTATLTERLRIDSAGNVIVNTAAIATGATDGFLYVPTCAGTPTGTPTTYTGRAPIVVDTTNNKLYFHSGSWRDAGP
jgi:hypothetical protein